MAIPQMAIPQIAIPQITHKIKFIVEKINNS
jgi:hypothetical protein